jgi:Protein of unknown function (DUF2846)
MLGLQATACLHVATLQRIEKNQGGFSGHPGFAGYSLWASNPMQHWACRVSAPRCLGCCGEVRELYLPPVTRLLAIRANAFPSFRKNFPMKKLIAVSILAFSLVGCASVTMGDAKQDAALKTFTIAKDKAGVYIYRNETMGAAIKMNVELDGKSIGQTAANTYLYKEVTPGKHTIVSKAENDSSIEVDAQPGTLLYVWQEVKMGLLGARSKLQLVDQAQGQKGVMETKLAETK